MAKKAITWNELLALNPCPGGTFAALATFPDWPTSPPMWEDVLLVEEHAGYRCWLIARVLPSESATTWTTRCLDETARLYPNPGRPYAGFLHNIITATSRSEFLECVEDATASAEGYLRRVAFDRGDPSVPSVYSLALPFLEAL